MVREDKKEKVKELAEELGKCTIAIATDFRGLKVAQLNQLRRKLREQGVAFRVVKNTLAQRAAEEVGKPLLGQLLTGPTALALGQGVPSIPSKTLTEFARSTGLTLNLRGGLLENRLLTPQQVIALASLPGREVLLAQVVGAVQGPLASLIQTLSAPLQALLLTLQGIQHSLESQPGQTAQG